METQILTYEQKNNLIDLLSQEGFRVGRQGHVHIIKPDKSTHSKDYFMFKNYFKACGQINAPVGFIGEKDICLVNGHKNIPKNYHKKLRNIIKKL
jgi:hypothetical protein